MVGRSSRSRRSENRYLYSLYGIPASFATLFQAKRHAKGVVATSNNPLKIFVTCRVICLFPVLCGQPHGERGTPLRQASHQSGR
jgi:hypothetical protein